MLTDEQLEVRRGGVGGSEIAAILGLDRFAGPLEVYLRKVEGLVTEPSEDMLRGSFLEGGVADWYGYQQQVTPIEVSQLFGEPTLKHHQHAVALASPDRLAHLGEAAYRLISIKCPRRWGDDWGETQGELPEGYVLQLQWEDAVIRSQPNPPAILSAFHLAAMSEGELRVYQVERDLELQGWLLDHAEAWWQRHVVARVPPPLDGSDAATAWLRRRFPRDVRPMRPATLEESVLMMEFRAVEAQWVEVDAAYETKRQQLEEAIADGGGLTSAIGRVTFKANKHGRRSLRTTWSKESTQ